MTHGLTHNPNRGLQHLAFDLCHNWLRHMQISEKVVITDISVFVLFVCLFVCCLFVCLVLRRQ